MIRLVEALDRIPDEYEHLTYFSRYDLWFYRSVMDPGSTCTVCAAYNGSVLYGTHLRDFFPYLEVEDENHIHPHVHPNCRCDLERMTL
jgi:hypothetical protein